MSRTVIAASVALALGLVAIGASPSRRIAGTTALPFSLIFVLGLAVPTVLALSPLHAVVALILAASAGDVVRRWRRRRRRRTARARGEALVLACQSIASDLRAGAAPTRALEAAAEDWSALRPVARAGELGADVPGAFRRLAAERGAEHARIIAAAWQVTQRTGAPLAPALDRVVAALRRHRSLAAVVDREIAAARATATLLSLLPVGLLVAGRGMGADPWGFLVGSPGGVACLGTGLALTHAGLAWLDRIAESATA